MTLERDLNPFKKTEFMAHGIMESLSEFGLCVTKKFFFKIASQGSALSSELCLLPV
jgi:hypothetical protein